MKRGLLEIVSGPMFAGKSSFLLKRANECSGKVVAFKPAFDTRYSNTEVKTHNGTGIVAINVSKPADLKVAQDAEMVLFDEIQFFDAPHYSGSIVDDINSMLDKGINVVCAGLDTSWQGNDFVITKRVEETANIVTKTTAVCSVCGEPATRSFKFGGSSAEIELGSADIYEPRCEKHFLQPHNISAKELRGEHDHAWSQKIAHAIEEKKRKETAYVA